MLEAENVDGLRYLGLVKCLRLLRMGRILRYVHRRQRNGATGHTRNQA